MTNPQGSNLTAEDFSFIEEALNFYWHNANINLKLKDLGDIERKNYEFQKSESKRLMDLLSSPQPLVKTAEEIEKISMDYASSEYSHYPEGNEKNGRLACCKIDYKNGILKGLSFSSLPNHKEAVVSAEELISQIPRFTTDPPKYIHEDDVLTVVRKMERQLSTQSNNQNTEKKCTACKGYGWNGVVDQSSICNICNGSGNESNNQEQKTDAVEFAEWKEDRNLKRVDNNGLRLYSNHKDIWRKTTSELYTLFKSSVPPSINDNTKTK